MESIFARTKFEDVATEISKNAEEEIFGEKVGIIARIFGCKHSRLSKPVTTKNITYRFCPNCGIRRRYDLESFKAVGSYYYPADKKELYHV